MVSVVVVVQESVLVCFAHCSQHCLMHSAKKRIVRTMLRSDSSEQCINTNVAFFHSGMYLRRRMTDRVFFQPPKQTSMMAPKQTFSTSLLKVESCIRFCYLASAHPMADLQRARIRNRAALHSLLARLLA